jgi:hypothetical protein
VSLAFSVLLERILHANLFTQHVLAIEVRDGRITAFKIAKADKPKPFAISAIVPRDLGQAQQRAEPGEGVVEQLFVRHGI